MSDDVVTDIIQDSKGYIWISTYRGLSRFNGNDFSYYFYDENDETSLSHNLNACLLEDHEGKIWVGSAVNSVSVFDPETEKFERLYGGDADSLQITNNSVRVIFEDSDFNIWVGTEYGFSIISKDRKNFKKYYCDRGDCAAGFNCERVYDVVEDNNRKIWLATEDNRLIRYDMDKHTFQKIKYSTLPLDKFEDNLLKNLYLQNDSLLWIASNNAGLSKLNVNTLQYKTYASNGSNTGPSSMQIRDVLEVGNKLWLATDGSGLDIFDPVSETFINHRRNRNKPKSISSDGIWRLFKDKQGIIWLGTFQGGINKYDPGSNYFKLLDQDTQGQGVKFPSVPILSLVEDKDENVWIGTDWGGLYCLKDDRVIKHYTSDAENNKLSTNVVKSLSLDHSDNLILGTYNHGLTFYDRQTNNFKHYYRNEINGPPNNNIWAILTDSRNETWIGTLGEGIAKFDSKTGSFNRPTIDCINSSFEHIYNIFEDSKSNLWFSTDGGVLFHDRRTNSWECISTKDVHKSDNIEINEVRAVVEDNLRHIWMATAAGLLRYIPEKDEYRLFSIKDGIPQLPLLALSIDDYGNLIIASRTYISQFDLSKESVISYSIDDNSFSYNSILKRKNGEIMLAGTNGITRFHPEDLRKNEFIPPVFITGFETFGKGINSNSDSSRKFNTTASLECIDLNYDHTMINIKYAALNYTETDRNQFAFMLEGFDTDWHMVSNRREATYTNLDPGSYTFKVKAANNHGVWNNEGSQIEIHVSPPFWKTYWFMTLATLLIATLIYLIIKLRLNRIRRAFKYERLKTEQEVNTLKNDSLKKELASTQSEMNSVTMSYLHKNQKLQQVRQQIVDIADKFLAAEKWRVDGILKNIDKEIEDHDYWDKFEHQFNKSHDNFLERFKQAYPDLSKRELRLCAYLRMGLSNSEISILLNVTIRTVEQSRYRIRKKVVLEDRQSFTKMILRF